MTKPVFYQNILRTSAFLCFALPAFLAGETVQAATSVDQQVDSLQQRVSQLEDKLKQPDSVVHLAGYGSAGYASSDAGSTF